MVRILQVIGKKKSGKTATILSFIEAAKKQKIKIAVIKHSHHVASVDVPQTDTDRFFKAGAQQVGLNSRGEFFWREQELAADLPTQLQRFAQSDTQLILIEGYKDVKYPKVLLLRPQDRMIDFKGPFEAVATLAKTSEHLDFSTDQARQNWFTRWY